jgi:hypothetical protein
VCTSNWDGLKAIEQRLDNMRQKIDHLKRVDVGAELSDWQTEDLHRNRPFTMRSRAKGRAATVIRPHSLYEVQRSARYQHASGVYGRQLARRLAKAKRTLRVIKHFEPKTSTRPYLRAELEEQLIDRVGALLHEKLKW